MFLTAELSGVGQLVVWASLNECIWGQSKNSEARLNSFYSDPNYLCYTNYWVNNNCECVSCFSLL